MISFEQYKALVYISDHPGTTKASCSGKITEDVLDSLLDDDLIQWDESAVQWIDTNSPINPIGLERDYQNAILFVTPAGHAAMEEYEAAQRSEQREDESLEAVKRELELHRREIKHTMIWSAVNSILTVVSIGISLYSIFHG